ncbi:hypothetical protein [Psychrilyobacter atlanticus]|uniref:hypothetical protein n=1 Tax=Psychrilyobacter atlanticus TaxID=271091 RepID=UPI0003F7A161|nr:hypothetical protein [Psychrilyobacter atlanticus]
MKLKKGTIYFKSGKKWRKAAAGSTVYGCIIYRDYIELTEFEKSYEYERRSVELTLLLSTNHRLYKHNMCYLFVQ